MGLLYLFFTQLHLVGHFCKNCIMMHGTLSIKSSKKPSSGRETAASKWKLKTEEVGF